MFTVLGQCLGDSSPSTIGFTYTTFRSQQQQDLAGNRFRFFILPFSEHDG